MNFFEVMRNQFGMDPAGSQMASAAPTPEAADPSTPSPTGRVLARLPTPGHVRPSDMDLNRGPFAAPAQNPGTAAMSDLTGGLSELHPGLNAKNSFLLGLMGSMRAAGERENRAQAAQVEAQKANLEYNKSLFEMDHKAQEADRQLAKDAEEGRHNRALEDLTGQHYSALNDYYKKGGAGGAPGVEPEMKGTDLSLVTQRAAKTAGYGQGYDPSWDTLDDTEKERRRQTFQAYVEMFSKGKYTIGPDGRPVRKTGAMPTTPVPEPAGAPTATPELDEDETAPTAAPPAPVSPAPAPAPAPSPAPAPAAAGAQTAPAPAPSTVGTWRRATAPDGTKWLVNPITGDKIPAQGQ